MSRAREFFKDVVALISGFRKLILTLIGIGAILVLSLLIITAFGLDWYLHSNLIGISAVTDLLKVAIEYIAKIVLGYMTANVCVKGIYQWIKKKK